MLRDSVRRRLVKLDLRRDGKPIRFAAREDGAFEPALEGRGVEGAAGDALIVGINECPQVSYFDFGTSEIGHNLLT
jgi:hypothetical protein